MTFKRKKIYYQHFVALFWSHSFSFSLVNAVGFSYFFFELRLDYRLKLNIE